MANEAIGLIETKGIVAAVEALDAALKAANVSYTRSPGSFGATAPATRTSSASGSGSTSFAPT